MSIGLYTITTRATGTIVTSTIYNTDHQNHINNQNPEMTGAYSDSVSQMQIETYPGAVGSESLALNLAGEIERLRYQLGAITGNQYWYQAPLATIVGLVNRIAQIPTVNYPIQVSQGGTGTTAPGAAATNIGALSRTNNLTDLTNVGQAQAVLGLQQLAFCYPGSGLTLNGAQLNVSVPGYGFDANNPGYYEFPGGLILQWGTVNIPGSGVGTFNMPATFPNGLVSAQVSVGGQTSDNTYAPTIHFVNSNTLQIYGPAGMGTMVWALGW